MTGPVFGAASGFVGGEEGWALVLVLGLGLVLVLGLAAQVEAIRLDKRHFTR